MTGNLAGALEARGIPHYPEKRPLIITIRVKYTVKIPRGERAEAERTFAVYESRCPASQSVRRGIHIQWEGTIIEE